MVIDIQSADLITDMKDTMYVPIQQPVSSPKLEAVAPDVPED